MGLSDRNGDESESGFDKSMTGVTTPANGSGKGYSNLPGALPGKGTKGKSSGKRSGSPKNKSRGGKGSGKTLVRRSLKGGKSTSVDKDDDRQLSTEEANPVAKDSVAN